MENCPKCASENIYYSKKRKIYVCEDCDATFSEEEAERASSSALAEEKHLELFFSYGHDRNRLLVERIKKDMELRGHHVWIDTSEIKAGDYWREEIVNGLLNSAGVIAFLSEYSTRNPGVCLDELKIAVCVKGADIKTVLLEPEAKINQPVTISGIQWLDMSQWLKIKQSGEFDFEQWYKTKFAELCESIESDKAFEFRGDICFLKEKLRPYVNSEKEHLLLSRNFYGRHWLEDFIENWQDRTDSKALVIYGKPGSGKSAFCVNYAHYNSDVYGVFLCEWNRENTINPNKLIRTMAFRLATKLPDYRAMLIYQLNENQDNNLDSMNSDALFDFLIAYPLNNLINGNRPSGLIIVDGLDEAELNGSNQIAEVFERSIELLPKWIKFIFTSRAEKSVISHLKAFDKIDLIDDMPSGYNDIMAYLIKSLAQELKEISNKLEVINKICAVSEGVFLYAVMLVEGIKDGTMSIQNVDEFPHGLNGAYRVFMHRKFDGEAQYNNIRPFLEAMCIDDTIPENLIIEVYGFSKYKYLKLLDKLGSLVDRHKGESELYLLGFSHKSIRDWLTNPEQSQEFYIDRKNGALSLAAFCQDWIEENLLSSYSNEHGELLDQYIKQHVCLYYTISGRFDLLESFMLSESDNLDLYWLLWNKFPDNWNHKNLFATFWNSASRNLFLKNLQREGNTELLLWILDRAKKRYGVKHFDRDMVSIYVDITHLSGEYVKAVDIARRYLKGYTTEEVVQDEFLSMLCVRKIHHSMFYKSVEKLLDDALSLYGQISDRYPIVYNELLFLIGGNLGVLYGDWNFCEEWLNKSENFANCHGLLDYHKRNSRKLADCLCHAGKYEEAQYLISRNLNVSQKITDRYEAYLIGALGNIHTCMGNDDDALECYGNLLRYVTAKGMPGWAAHANLGIGNVNFRLGNIREAIDFAKRANAVYKRIQSEWGLIMSEALLAACESRLGVEPLKIACRKAIKRAKRLSYGSCVSSIEDLCNNKTNFLKLYFL